MRDVDNLNICFTRGIDRGAEIVEQSDVCGNVAEHRKELAAIRKKIVYGSTSSNAVRSASYTGLGISVLKSENRCEHVRVAQSAPDCSRRTICDVSRIA
jgi:hypothetical protein